jgi:hypothetical protein
MIKVVKETNLWYYCFDKSKVFLFFTDESLLTSYADPRTAKLRFNKEGKSHIRDRVKYLKGLLNEK